MSGGISVSDMRCSWLLGGPGGVRTETPRSKPQDRRSTFMADKYVPRLKEKYYAEVRDALQKQFNYPNPMMIPKFEKIVVNMGVGEAATDAKAIDGAVADLRAITGQQPMITHARKSIATFHLRQGQAIGAKVTLRGDRMWEFLDRLIATAIPRIRDFRGISPKSFDGRGNFSMGVTEQLIFPEIEFDKIDHTRGMDITIVTTAETDEEGKALLDAYHFPFKAE
jgi:large subunit ribosomal protein L5